MHKLFKRVDPPSSGSPSPVTAPGGKQDYSEDEEFFDSKPMNDDDVSSIGTRRTITTTNGKRVVVGDSTAKSGSESEGGHKTPRGYSSEEFQNSHPPKSTTSSGKRSVTESSYPDDEQYETCEDQSVKDARPVIMPRTSPDESRYYSDTGSSSYTQLKNFKGLSSSILSSTKPRSMSIDDQMSQVSSLSSMSMEPATVPLTGLAFVQLNMNNGGGNNGTGGTGTRHNSQDTEPSYALSALQDEVGASSGVEEDDDQQSVDKDSVQNTVTEQKEDDNSRIGTNSNVKTSESTNNGTTENGQHPKMQAEDEKRIMLALFSLHPSSLQQQQQMDETAAFRLSNSTNTSENQFYTKNIKVTSTMPDNRACLFKEKLRLVQSLKPHDGSIWTMKFSPNGHYLASGGQDMKVMVWAVGKLPTDTNNDTDHEDWPPEDDDLDDDQKATSSNSGGLGIDQFVCPDPYRIFEGHSGDVIDISWSKSNFILSASMDLTVRLWHVTRNDCLQHFRHPDVVTCVEFHPTIDRYFITGCFDRRLRVWDIIPDGTVKEWVQATDTITSISFSPDGSTVASGLIQGQIYFYEYESLKYKTQIDCRNRNGKYKRGTKVTGMCFNVKKDAFQQMQQQQQQQQQGQQGTTNSKNVDDHNNNAGYTARRPKSTNRMPDLLISTNDSRIRYCRLEDYSFTCKYKGLTNKTMQIKATFSDDGRLIISGSEDGMVYIWRANEDAPSRRYSMFRTSDIQKNTFFESFQVAYDNAATIVSVFAPSESVKHFVKVQEKLLEILKSTELQQQHQQALNAQPMKDQQKRNSKTFRGSMDLGRQRGRESFISTDPIGGIGGAFDTSCRVIATADSDGYIRFFFRLS